MTTAAKMADYIIAKCIRDDCPITNLQLQKILYCCQKRYIAVYNDLLFSDNFEAYSFGPAIPQIYYNFSRFGSHPINKRYSEIDIEKNIKKVIDPVIEEKRVLAPWDLAEDAHKDGGAWAQTYNNGSGYKKIISIDLIKSEIY
jgi:uncharacterized phage-associated protein